MRGAVRDVRLFLEGRHSDLAAELRERMQQASDEMRFEEAAALRDLLATVEEMEERQKMAAAEGRRHRHLRLLRRAAAGRRESVSSAQRPDRRPARILLGGPDRVRCSPQFFCALLKQIYLDQQYVPAIIHVPVDFEDREALEEVALGEAQPQGGDPHAAARPEESAAGPGGDQRQAQLRRAFPRAEAVFESDSGSAAGRAGLPEAPQRIECFDISHIQGTDKVASMVVWEDGRMKKSDYRKFIIRTVIGNDDFASMREVVTRRYARLQEENQPMPGLVLIDGGLGQLHAAAEALEALGIINQPLASIAKREELIYVLRPGERADRARPLLADPASDPDRFATKRTVSR